MNDYLYVHYQPIGIKDFRKAKSYVVKTLEDKKRICKHVEELKETCLKIIVSKSVHLTREYKNDIIFEWENKDAEKMNIILNKKQEIKEKIKELKAQEQDLRKELKKLEP